MSFLFSTKSDTQLKYIPAEKIFPNPHQPRKNFDEESIRALADSISKYGIIQPISVRQKDGSYELVAGERRLRAARLCGLSEIPCVVIKASEKKSAEMAMIENIQRKNLDIFEEAEAIEKLLAKSECTQAQLAGSLSMSQSALANKLRILRYTAEQREMIRRFGLGERHARAILRLPPEKRTECISYAGRCEMSANELEIHVDKILYANILRDDGVKRRTRRKNAVPEPVDEPSKDTSPIRTILIGDLSLFYNSLSRSLEMLDKAGFDTKMQKEEQGDEVRLSIILKNVKRKEKNDK